MQTALFVFFMSILKGRFSIDVFKSQAILQNIKGKKATNLNLGYEAQELFSELSAHLCTSLMPIIHSQALSARKQNSTAALFIHILMPSMA